MYLRLIIILLSYLAPNGITFGSESEEALILDKIGGIWIENGDHGYYRARVFRTIKTGLQVDSVTINEYSYRHNNHKPRTNYELPSPGVKGLIGDITFRMIDGQRMLLYLDIETSKREVARIREVYLLSPGGKFVVLEKAQDMDNIPFK
ncbi:MAG: hypothetical protein OEX19_00695 [Gammaproteobacteria bacterium]|nr:hypothetical protein [Gammaproteobacteria bacterium]